MEAEEAARGRVRAGERIGLGQCRLAHILLAAHLKMAPTFSDRPLNPDIQSNEICGWLSRHAPHVRGKLFRTVTVGGIHVGRGCVTEVVRPYDCCNGD